MEQRIGSGVSHRSPHLPPHPEATLDIIARLETTRDQTLDFFDSTPNRLDAVYASGKWSVGHLLHHLADAESVLYDRIRRTISKPGGVVWDFDQDAWAAGLDYANLPLEVSKNFFAATRAAVIEQARRNYEKNGHLEFIHRTTGLRTLKDEFDKVAWHNAHHLEQIQRALGE